MNSQRGFTLVELLLALSLGTLVLLLVGRAFMIAVATQEQVVKDLVIHQNARATLQWIARSAQAAAEVRAGTSNAVELAGIFDPTRGFECRGFFVGPLQSSMVVYERRRVACAEGATSEGGEVLVVSDPRTSVSLLSFRYLMNHATAADDAKNARLLEVSIEVDADRDGQSEGRLAQLAALRLR